MTDDPNSVADAPTPAEIIHSAFGEWWEDDDEPGLALNARILAALTAAGFEVVPAGTADRLAALTERTTGDPTSIYYECEQLRAERDAVAAELFEAQHLIGILLDRLGGEVTLTEAEVVAVPRGRTITTFRNDHDFRVIVRVGS